MDDDLHELAPARVPFRTVLASIVGLWLCYFLLVTIRSELFDLGFEQEMLWRRAIASLAGVAIMVGLWLVLRLFDTRPLWAKITAALLLSRWKWMCRSLRNVWSHIFVSFSQAIMAPKMKQVSNIW